MARRRDAVLEAVECFRRAHPGGGLTQLLAFLYIAENEGLNVTELATACAMTTATASRVCKALACGASGDARVNGLVTPRPNPHDAKGRVLHLSTSGVQLRDRIDRAIAAGVRIGAPRTALFMVN